MDFSSWTTQDLINITIKLGGLIVSVIVGYYGIRSFYKKPSSNSKTENKPHFEQHGNTGDSYQVAGNMYVGKDDEKRS